MNIRYLLVTACSIALAAVGCASTEEPSAETTPAAVEGAPSTVEPTSGAETPAQPVPATTPATAPAAEVTPVTPAAITAQPAAPVQPTIGAVITHKVKDFDAWKTVFDSHADARQQASILGHSVMRDASNDKLVSVWVGATDETKLKAFFADKATADKMKEAGVVGKPEILIMKPVEQKMDPSKTGLSSALVKASVKDFAAFQAAFDQGAQARTDAGIVGFGLAQDVANAGTAYLYLQSDDLAKLKAYIDSKDTKKAWKDAGVKGAAKTSYLKEGESKTYSK